MLLYMNAALPLPSNEAHLTTLEPEREQQLLWNPERNKATLRRLVHCDEEGGHSGFGSADTVDTLSAHIAGALGIESFGLVEEACRLALDGEPLSFSLVSLDAALSAAGTRRLDWSNFLLSNGAWGSLSKAAIGGLAKTRQNTGDCKNVIRCGCPDRNDQEAENFSSLTPSLWVIDYRCKWYLS